MAAGHQHAIGALLEGFQNEQRIHAARAGNANDADVGLHRWCGWCRPCRRRRSCTNCREIQRYVVRTQALLPPVGSALISLSLRRTRRSSRSFGRPAASFMRIRSSSPAKLAVVEPRLLSNAVPPDLFKCRSVNRRVDVSLNDVLPDEHLRRQQVLYGQICNVLSHVAQSVPGATSVLWLRVDQHVQVERGPRIPVYRERDRADDYVANATRV